MENIDEILQRIRWLYRVKTDIELAGILQIPYKTLATWKTRKNIPVKRMQEISKNKNTSLDWIINGDTTISNNQNSVIIGGDNSGNIINSSVPVSGEFMEVVELYNKYGSPELLKQFKNKLLKMKKLVDE